MIVTAGWQARKRGAVTKTGLIILFFMHVRYNSRLTWLFASAGFVWRPNNSVAVPDAAGETLIKLIETLDDHDDVQNVYGNYELSDALLAKLSG